jgi:hypothetical protein
VCKFCCLWECICEWNRNKEKFSDGKLGTYITVKNNFGFEIKNFEQRRTLTRFRIFAHKLAIETGRYKIIPRRETSPNLILNFRRED